MLKESNVRYGVVNKVMREKYEKEFHVPFGYDYISYKKGESIAYCKTLKKDADYKNVIVERIFDTAIATNKKEQIFRGGVLK